MKVEFVIAVLAVGSVVAFHLYADMSGTGLQWRRHRRFAKLVRARLRPRGQYAVKIPFWNETRLGGVTVGVDFDQQLGTYVLLVHYRREGNGGIQYFELTRLGMHAPIW